MAGENNGKPLQKMDDLVVKPTFFGNINSPIHLHSPIPTSHTVFELAMRLAN